MVILLLKSFSKIDVISFYSLHLLKPSPGMDDLLFTNRNKTYGAYLLRQSYPKNMTLGILLSIVIFLMILILPGIQFKTTQSMEFMTPVELNSPPEATLPVLPAQPALKPPANIQKKNEAETKKSEYKKVVKEDHKIVPSSSEANKLDTSNKITTLPSVDSAGFNMENNLVYDFADVMPQYPGGTSSLSRFISSKLVYPNTAIQNKIEGIVVVGFVIDKDGIVRNPKIIKSLYFSCDEEALRVLKLIPVWIPAKNNNRNVSFNFKLPIEFKLNK